MFLLSICCSVFYRQPIAVCFVVDLLWCVCHRLVVACFVIELFRQVIVLSILASCFRFGNSNEKIRSDKVIN